MPRKPRQTSDNAFETADGVLDATNQRLLGELHADARISTAALARKVGLSAPSVAERLRRLADDGVIAGYRVQVDPAALGLPVTAFARVRPFAGQLAKIVKLAESIPNVVECYRITGEDCFLLKVHAPAVQRLEDILDRFLVYGQTTTSIVVSTPIPQRPLPPMPAS